ncbi:hypothetical protein H0W26_01915 [Candidatus Dependentiae bacterium]|nr:hypothetical protein [Candidatus Dependentiae bacterium]
MSSWYVKDVWEIPVVVCIAFSIELNAMEISSTRKVSSLQEIASRCLIEHNPEYDFSSHEAIDRILGSNYCSLHMREFWWSALATIEVIPLNKKLTRKMHHIKSIIPLKKEQLIIVDKGAKWCLIKRSFSFWQLLYEKSLHHETDSVPMTTSFVVSTDQAYGMSSLSNGDVSVWLLESGKLIKTFHHPCEVVCAAFNESMTQVVTGSVDNSISVWDYEKGERIWTALCQESRPRALAFLTDDRYVCAAETNFMHKWNITEDKKVAELAMKKRSIGSFATLFPDGHGVSVDISSSMEMGSFEDNSMSQYDAHDKGITVTAVAVTTTRQLFARACYKSDQLSKHMVYKIILSSLPEVEEFQGSPSPQLLHINELKIRGSEVDSGINSPLTVVGSEVTVLTFGDNNQSLFYGTYEGNIGIISFKYLTSLLGLKQAKLVVKLIKRCMKKKTIQLDQDQQTTYYSLDTRIKQALESFFVARQISFRTQI